MATRSAVITVSYTELDGSPIEYVSNEQIVVERKLKCAWGDRLTLAKELVGHRFGGVLYLPHEYWPAGNENLRFCFCKSCHIEVLGAYQNAKLTAVYETQAFTARQDTYVSERIEVASDFLTLGEKDLVWADGGADVTGTEVPSKLERMTEWVYTIHKALFVPTKVYTLVGGINKKDVYSPSLGVTFDKETLLYVGPSLQREWTSDGISAWTITLRFMHRSQSWNKFPQGGTGTGTEMNYSRVRKKDDTGNNTLNIYALTDLRSLVE